MYRHRSTLHRAACLATLALPAVLWLVSCSPPPDVSDRASLHRRDVILVTVDTLRADAVGAYNPEAGPTPVIDSLAERGLLFSQATAPMPRTTPSLASLLTGRSPKFHGSREVGMAMSSDVPLLTQVLRRPELFGSGAGESGEAGPYSADVPYLNVAVSASRAAAAGHGLGRGFDVFKLVPSNDPKADEVTQTTLASIGRALEDPDNGERPLFLWVHFLDPHFPYEPLDDPPTDPPTEPPTEPEGDTCEELLEVYDEFAVFAFLDHDGVSTRALEDCTRRYHGEAARADRAIGRLFDGLREMGRPPEESLVIFTSDHGEHLGEAGFFFKHGPDVHDAALRVPLIVAGPGIDSGRSDQVVELLDVAPTVLELVGVQAEAVPPMDGQSLAARWLGEEGEASGEDRIALAESNSNLRPRVWTTVVSGREERHCVHQERWSLCGPGDKVEDFRLFDHEADPRFQVELTEEHPEIVERLWRQRQAWPPETAHQRAARTPRFKLVESPVASGGYERRLYDLQADPAESLDVSADHPRVAERLGRALDEYVADLPALGHTALEEDDLEALRTLGYVE